MSAFIEKKVWKSSSIFYREKEKVRNPKYGEKNEEEEEGMTNPSINLEREEYKTRGRFPTQTT